MEDAGKPAIINMHDVSEVNEIHVVDNNGRQAPAEPTGWLCCMPCHWLKTNNSVHKASLTVVSLLVTSILVASPVLFLISSAPSGEQPVKSCYTMEEDECFPDPVDGTSDREICDSVLCRDLARKVQFPILWPQEPCKDFYKFACGGWAVSKAKHSTQPFKPSTSNMDLSFSTMQTSVDLTLQQLLVNNATGTYEKLGLFYGTCMKEAMVPQDVTPMYTLLEELGGYLPPGSLGPTDMTPLVAEILKVNGAPMVDIYLDRDLKNSSNVAIFVDLPKSGGLLRTAAPFNINQPWEPRSGASFKVKGNKCVYKPDMQKREAREESPSFSYLKDAGAARSLLYLENVISGMLPKGITNKQRSAEIHQILLFAAASEQILPGRKEIFNHLQDISIMEEYNIGKLQSTFPFLKWRYLLNELLPATIIIEERIIYVMCADYLKNLEKMMQYFEKRVIQNSLLALYARDFLYDIVILNSSSLEERARFCTHLTSASYGHGVSALYLSQYSQNYLNGVTATVQKMFFNLKRALYDLVEKAEWVDDRTKSLALLKITAIRGQFSAWPPLLNRTFMAVMLQQLDVTDNFFDNIVNRHRYSRKYSDDISQLLPENLTWPFPFVVNAFYEPLENIVVVPLALLTQPQSSPEAPLYISYATTGAILAHELLHSLDRRGVGYISFGKDDNKHDMKSNKNPNGGEYIDYEGDHYDAELENDQVKLNNAFYDLWTNRGTAAELWKRTDCLVKQNAAASRRKVKFLGNEVDVEFDWNATSEENAADVVGTRVAMIAWRALSSASEPKKGGALLPGLPMMTRRKLFYLATAQMYCSVQTAEEYIVGVETDFHTPSHERVNGIIRNSVSFSEAFGCPVNSPMNPAKKCLIW